MLVQVARVFLRSFERGRLATLPVVFDVFEGEIPQSNVVPRSIPEQDGEEELRSEALKRTQHLNGFEWSLEGYTPTISSRNRDHDPPSFES